VEDDDMSSPFDPPQPISPEEMAQVEALGEAVRQVLVSAGIPVFFQRDPQVVAEKGAGAHIGVDPTTAGQVEVRWECDGALEAHALAASKANDYRHPAVRQVVRAAFAIAEAMVTILREVGYEAGMGVDMSESSVWVRRGFT
jgi:hypothetical protein